MDKLFHFMDKIKITETNDESKNINFEQVEPSTIIRKKKYDHKKYNDAFMLKHKETINKRNICDVCCGSYSYFNKSKHQKSKRHILMAEKNKNINGL